MNTKLSHDEIIKLPARQKAFEHWVKEAPGLLIRIYPSGTKSYVLQYGRKKRKTLGKVGALSFELARDQAKSLMRLRDEIKADEAVGNTLLNSRVASKRRKYGEAQAIAAGKIIETKDVTLEAFLANYYERPSATKTRLSEHDEESANKHQLLKSYRESEADQIRRRFPMFLKLPLQSISARDVKVWLDDRIQSVSQSTARRNIASLRASLSVAVDTEISPDTYLLDHNPLLTDRAKRQLRCSVAAEQPRSLNQDQQLRLRHALDERERELSERLIEQRAKRKKLHFYDHIKPIVLLALLTGLRRKELFSLEWQSVSIGDEKKLVVTARTAKTNRTRTIWLDAEAAQLIHSWEQDCKARGQDTHGSALLFQSPRSNSGQLVTIKKAWTYVRKIAELPEVKFHDLRHTYANNLNDQGLDIPSIQNQLGHSNIRMTSRYVKASDRAVRNRLMNIWEKENT